MNCKKCNTPYLSLYIRGHSNGKRTWIKVGEVCLKCKKPVMTSSLSEST